MSSQQANRSKPVIQSHYLDVLRGIAALVVLVSHADHAGLLLLGLDSVQKVFLGRFGVYLFFILSGFLIWNSAQVIRRPTGLMTYGIHRVTRLLPLYLANIAFVVFVLPHLDSAYQPNVTLEVVLRHLTLTQSLNPSVSRDLNPVLWTLTHEALFYALVPLLLLVRVTLLPWIGGLAILLSWLPSTFSQFLSVFHLFTVGILFAERRPAWACLSLIVFSLMQNTAQPYAAQEIWGRLAAGAMFAAAMAAPAAGKVLSQPMRWVGKVSFSLYIWHYLLINILGTQTGWRAMYNATYGLSLDDGYRGGIFLALALGISAVSYQLIERPGMGWLREKLLARMRGEVPASPGFGKT